MKDPPAEPREGAHLLQGVLVIPPLDLLPLHYVLTLLLEAPGGSGAGRRGAKRGKPAGASNTTS